MVGVQWLNVFSNFLQLSEIKYFGSTDKLLKFFSRVQLLEHFVIKKFEESLLK
jgi:hypothetical protein